MYFHSKGRPSQNLADMGTTNIPAKMHSKRISSWNTAFKQKGQPQYLVVGLFFNCYVYKFNKHTQVNTEYLQRSIDFTTDIIF